MYEFQVPTSDHIELPSDLKLEGLFPLTVGTLGDFAAETVWAELREPKPQTEIDEVRFAARALQAYVDSHLAPSISPDLLLLASAAHYLADAPGSALVALRKLRATERNAWGSREEVLEALLGFPWQSVDHSPRGETDETAREVLASLYQYYEGGVDVDALSGPLVTLRDAAYQNGRARDVLLADLIAATTFRRVRQSARALLPHYSGIEASAWEPYLTKESSLRELWPSQQILGEAGVYRGLSAVIQMPTSAGKTKATELIIRASLLGGRASVVVVVAPFRALCQEIADSLRLSFADELVTINQLTDALQPDYFSGLEALFAQFEEPAFAALGPEQERHVIVLTPEKLLYALRQSPELATRIGLIVYDEAHQFDSGGRGVTFELLVTALKRVIPTGTQTVLASAVVTNAQAVAQWMFGDEKQVVIDRKTQTERNLAFASWTDRLGRLTFFDSGAGDRSYFVPRVIAAHQLQRKPGERKARLFPARGDPISIGLYLALRLVPNGGVALFCGGKPSVGRILKEVPEHFERELALPNPRDACNPVEVAALMSLYTKHFGESSYLTRAAAAGTFGHHGDMPHGIRLSVEWAMRNQLIPLLVCTSTLAQGVNLPIRYLVVTGTRQGASEMRIRDFQNLMGRAGRAGIHGEGTIIFTDPRLYDARASRRDGWRWGRVQALVNERASDPTGSSLLELIQPLTRPDGRMHIDLDSTELVRRLLAQRAAVFNFAANPPEQLIAQGFDSKSLSEQLHAKVETISAVESFLMANRKDDDQPLLAVAEELCAATFAHHLATDAQKASLVSAFLAIARHIDDVVPDAAKQRRFGKALLGVADSVRVDEWVAAKVLEFAGAQSSDEIFDLVWPFLQQFVPSADISRLDPEGSAYLLAKRWIAGVPYEELVAALADSTLPYGKQRRKPTDVDDVLAMCEHEIGFNLTLVLAAVRESVKKEFEDFEEESAALLDHMDFLQKRMRYGLPSRTAIAFHELGFCDRVIAQELALVGVSNPNNVFEARNLVRSAVDSYQAAVSTYPAYMGGVLSRVLLA